MLGEPDKAIKFFKECIEGQDYWIQLHYACWWEVRNRKIEKMTIFDSKFLILSILNLIFVLLDYLGLGYEKRLEDRL